MSGSAVADDPAVIGLHGAVDHLEVERFFLGRIRENAPDRRVSAFVVRHLACPTSPGNGQHSPRRRAAESRNAAPPATAEKGQLQPIRAPASRPRVGLPPEIRGCRHPGRIERKSDRHCRTRAAANGIAHGASLGKRAQAGGNPVSGGGPSGKPTRTREGTQIAPPSYTVTRFSSIAVSLKCSTIRARRARRSALLAGGSSAVRAASNTACTR